MVTCVTGTIAGIENNTIANPTHSTATAFTTTPALPNPNGAPATPARPPTSEIAIGNAYDAPRHMTATPTNALNAVDDPR